MPNQGINDNGQGRESHLQMKLVKQDVAQVGGDNQTRPCQEAFQDAQRRKAKTYGPLNLEIGKGRASMRKESSKGEASKHII
jgi:hypothetical protein